VKASAGLLAGAALLLVAFNLRGAFVAVSPVLPEVRADTGMSAPLAGLLTTLPVLCFAAFSPAVPALARRWGMDRTLAVALGVLAGGILLRVAPGSAPLFAGTLVLGAAMAVGNVLLPGLIKRDFPGRIGLMTGLYVTAMGGGATVAAGATVLLEDATGLGWRPVIGLWALPAVLALVAVFAASRAARAERAARSPAAPAATAPARPPHLWRDRIAWQVVLFMGMQSLIYYCLTAWLPTLFSASGMSSGEAGFQLAVFNLIGLPASLLVPVAASRARDQVTLIAGACALTAAGLLGVVVDAQAAPLLWMAMLGIGQGATVGLALTLIGLRAPDADHAAELSGMVQSASFLIAAVGPFAMGALHDVLGSWPLAFALPIAALLPMTLAGLGAGRDRFVGRPAAVGPRVQPTSPGEVLTG
jgi:CP family cyanate transporter-like MFS transporter